MKGFWKHIAASASITAVFVVCALALAFSSVPVVPTPAQASRNSQGMSLAGSFSNLIETLDEAGEKAAAAAQPVAASETAVQPAPATAAPAVAPPAPPAPVPAAPQPEAPPAQPAAPPTAPLNPPAALAGTFVPDVPPRIELTWDANNSPSILSYFLVYREVVGQTELTVVQSGKSSYKDEGINLGSTYRYWVTAVSKSGEESGPSNTIEVATQVMDAPLPPQGIMAAALDPGVSLDWQPNTEANLAGYNVYVNQGGRWRKLNNSAILSDNHYYHKQGTINDTYAVSAVNVFGMESGYTVVKPQPTTPVLYEETDPAVAVEGFWAVERYLGASGGSIIVAETPGARLHFTFTGRQVKLIVAKYYTCGDARIFIDGDLMATVSLYSYDPVFQSIEVSVPGLKLGEHVLTIEVLGSGNPENAYNFVNVDAFEVR